VLLMGGCGGALPEGATTQAVASIARNGEGRNGEEEWIAGLVGKT
jgi:hypothetical protein